jgi:hypothetical protein
LAVSGRGRIHLGKFSSASRHRNFFVISSRRRPSSGGRKRKRRRAAEEGEEGKACDRKKPSFTIFPDSLDLIATGVSAEGGGSRLRIRVLKELVCFAADMNVGWVRRRACEVAILSGVCEKIPLRVTNSTYAGQVICGDLARDQTSMSLVLSRYVAMERADQKGNVQRQQQQQQQQLDQQISFRSQVFPGVRVKIPNVRGTINVFNNGKYVLVGVRSRQEAEALREALCAIMRQSWTTFGGETPCAWTAGGS